MSHAVQSPPASRPARGVSAEQLLRSLAAQEAAIRQLAEARPHRWLPASLVVSVIANVVLCLIVAGGAWMVVFGDQPAPSQSAAVPPQPVVTVPAPQPAGEPEPAKPEPVPVNRGPLEPIDETADAMASIHADGIVVKHDDIENTTRISLGGVAVGDGLWLMVNGMVDARTMFGMLMSRDGLVSIDRGFVTISGDRVDLLRANEVTDDTKAEDAVAATMGYLPMSVLDRICDSYKDATLRFRDSEGNEWTAVFDEAARIDIMRVREELRDLLSDE